MTSQAPQYGQYGGHNPYGGQYGQYGGQQYGGDYGGKTDDDEIPMGIPIDSNTPAYVRSHFIRKVYSILCVQLATTFIIGYYVNGAIQENYKLAKPLYYGSMVITMGTLCGVTCCCQQVARTFPANYVFLAILTVGMSCMTGVVTVMYTGPSVMIAVATTAVVFGCLTLYACNTSTDWTGCGPYLAAGLFAMIGFSFMMTLFCWFGLCPGTMIHKLYSAAGVLLFTFYIIYDTQLIVGGNHKNQYSVDDYVFAALNLYLDIINLFMYLLSLFGDRQS